MTRRRSAARCSAAARAVAWGATRRPSWWTASRWPCGSPTRCRRAGAAEVVAIGGDAAALERARARRSSPTTSRARARSRPPSPPSGTRRADVVVVLSCDLLAPNPAAIATLVDRLRGRRPGRGRRGPGGRRARTSGPTRRGAARPSAPLEAARRAGAASLRRACARPAARAWSPTSPPPTWPTPTNLAICQVPGSLRRDGRPGDRRGRAGGPAGRRRGAHRRPVAATSSPTPGSRARTSSRWARWWSASTRCPPRAPST